MSGLPGPAQAWAILAAIIEVGGGAALIVGFRTRAFALLLVLFNLFAAVIGHPYWSLTLHDAARGAGPLILDGDRRATIARALALEHYKFATGSPLRR
jgi:uncharacterized membrane protein YphA (DoxX/SURF4 family)